MLPAILAFFTLFSIASPLYSLYEMKEQRKQMRELNVEQKGRFYLVPKTLEDELAENTGTEVEQYEHVPTIPFPGFDIFISTLLAIATIAGFINWVL